jgi:hypothetical protein
MPFLGNVYLAQKVADSAIIKGLVAKDDDI